MIAHTRLHTNGVAALFALSLIAAPCAVRAADPVAEDTTRTKGPGITPVEVKRNPPVPHLFTVGDLEFLGGTIAALAIAVPNDRALTDEAIESESNLNLNRIADVFQPLGNPSYVLATSAALYGASHWFQRPRLARRSARMGLAVTLASGVSFGLKEAFGRARPYQSPGKPDNFQAFSGRSSFPSGHAATAFAAAVALDRETEGRWVPWVVYPGATLVAWSRVHQQRHWTSDVVGGAAIGGWVAWKAETFLANRALGVPTSGVKTSFMLAPRDGTVQLVMVRVLD